MYKISNVYFLSFQVCYDIVYLQFSRWIYARMIVRDDLLGLMRERPIRLLDRGNRRNRGRTHNHAHGDGWLQDISFWKSEMKNKV